MAILIPRQKKQLHMSIALPRTGGPSTVPLLGVERGGGVGRIQGTQGFGGAGLRALLLLPLLPPAHTRAAVVLSAGCVDTGGCL